MIRNVLIIKAYNLIMREYFFTEFIDFMLKDKFIFS